MPGIGWLDVEWFGFSILGFSLEAIELLRNRSKLSSTDLWSGPVWSHVWSGGVIISHYRVMVSTDILSTMPQIWFFSPNWVKGAIFLTSDKQWLLLSNIILSKFPLQHRVVYLHTRDMKTQPIQGNPSTSPGFTLCPHLFSGSLFWKL